MESHKFLYTGAILLFMLYVWYAFVYERKINICDQPSRWRANLLGANVRKRNVCDISHDDDMWYYKGKSTCVGYGKPREKCNWRERVCAGGHTMGSYMSQAREVAKAITSKGGMHRECPLVYVGAD